MKRRSKRFILNARRRWAERVLAPFIELPLSLCVELHHENPGRFARAIEILGGRS